MPSPQDLLAGMPFPWVGPTGPAAPCALLAQRGLHGCSAWLRACRCHGPDAEPWGEAAPLLRELWAAPGNEVRSSGTREQLAAQLEGWWGLGPADLPCPLSHLDSGADPPSDWASYCAARGVPPDSPAPLLLDATLTIFWAVQRLLASELRQQEQLEGHGGQQTQEQERGQEGQQGQERTDAQPRQLVVHCPGPQLELDQWPALLELGCLLPEMDIQLVLVGPDVPIWAHSHSLRVPSPAASACGRHGCACATAARHGRGGAGGSGQREQRGCARSGSMTLVFVRGSYEDYIVPLDIVYGSPELVVGLNAGLAAYHSWEIPVKRVASGVAHSGTQRPRAGERRSAGSGGRGRPRAGPRLCLFTDYNEEAVHRARQMVQGVVGPATLARLQLSGAEANPFRKPWLARPPDNRLPTFANGFGLWVERAAPP